MLIEFSVKGKFFDGTEFKGEYIIRVIEPP